MTRQLKGSFTLTDWDESTYQQLDGDSKLTKVVIGQQFSGDLEATGEWHGAMFYRPDGTAEYAGIQRIEGSVDGQQGSFVIDSWGAYDGTTAANKWRVIEGSGTGALAGVSGKGSSAAETGAEGTYSLDVDLG